MLKNNIDNIDNIEFVFDIYIINQYLEIDFINNSS